MTAGGSTRRVWSLVALIGTAALVDADVGQARAAGLSAWQEITVLTLSKLEAAAANCGFRIEGDKVALLLDSAGLTRDGVHDAPRSASLQQQIDAVTAAYRDDKSTACSQAWETFGPDGTARGYLNQ